MKPAKGTKTRDQDAINGFTALYDTNIDEGLRLGKTNLDNAPARSNAIKVVVLFTDGRSDGVRRHVHDAREARSDDLRRHRGVVHHVVLVSRPLPDTPTARRSPVRQRQAAARGERLDRRPRPRRRPSCRAGRSVTGANIRLEGIAQAEYWANELRKKGYLIYSIGLGNPFAVRRRTRTRISTSSAAVSNEKGIVSGSQPKGELMFAPTGAQLQRDVLEGGRPHLDAAHALIPRPREAASANRRGLALGNRDGSATKSGNRSSRRSLP